MGARLDRAPNRFNMGQLIFIFTVLIICGECMSYTPTLLTIISITQANPAVVTVSEDHNMTTGQVVRVRIPKPYGMQEINGQLVQITTLSATTFSLQYSLCNPMGAVNVDSTNFQAFSDVGTGTPPQVFPVGSGPTPVTSPQVYANNGTCVSPLDDAWTNIATVNEPF
jgi:hypothetical protein